MKAGHDLMGLIKYMGRGEWRDRFADVLSEHLGPALDAFDLEFEDLEDLLGEQWPMTLWGCAFEDFLTRTWEPGGETMADSYLKRRGRNESNLNKAYIRGLRDSVMSLYEVSAIVPGVSLMARDILRGGEPVLVQEKSATRSLRPWDHIAARLVRRGKDVILGGGLLPLSRDASAMLLETIEQSLSDQEEKLPLDTERVRVIAPLFSNAWLFDALPKAMGSGVPELSNSDGENLLFHEVRFPFAPGVVQKDVAARLDRLSALARASSHFWNWLDRNAGLPRAIGRMAFTTIMDDGSTVLGDIELKGKALLLSVNSAERAQRGIDMLVKALGDLVRPPLTAIQTVEQMMAARGDPPSQESELPPEVAREVVHAYLDRHYRETLDQPVGALDDMTPRQAATSAAGRKKLVAWLKLLENGGGRGSRLDDPMASYDFSWMWDELGVASLRR